jgi:hypothetical protein
MPARRRVTLLDGAMVDRYEAVYRSIVSMAYAA